MAPEKEKPRKEQEKEEEEELVLEDGGIEESPRRSFEDGDDYDEGGEEDDDDNDDERDSDGVGSPRSFQSRQWPQSYSGLGSDLKLPLVSDKVDGKQESVKNLPKTLGSIRDERISFHLQHTGEVYISQGCNGLMYLQALDFFPLLLRFMKLDGEALQF
nr:unnamed protein product [Digitaria exilis]